MENKMNRDKEYDWAGAGIFVGIIFLIVVGFLVANDFGWVAVGCIMLSLIMVAWFAGVFILLLKINSKLGKSKDDQ